MKQHSTGFLNLVQDALSRVGEISIDDVAEKINKGEDFILIDVREKEEWQQGYIPTAVHLSKGVIERDVERHIPDKNAELVLYCAGGFRSVLAADNLKKMGYQNIKSMQGGFSAWQAKHLKQE